MSILISYPEIQYVLLRSLHAIVIKRPMLLDKEYKYFYIQYNDPIYIKLEKVDILYKLTDKKNYEYIINEFTSYALTETDPELIRKSIKYIGYIGYKFESSLDLCVKCISKILDNKNEDSIPECIIVARDLMRKYKDIALNLIDKIINLELIMSLTDQNAKCAALFIIGEFCDQIPTSTELVSIFVNSFANVDINSKIKLQILNAAVKNFCTKPDESEELVKICLQKGAEESENPDVRDRSYIYWRLLETDPDVAKQMVCGEKPAFKFNEDDELDVDTIDDMINNMTNVSACYFKKEKDIINEEDLVVDEEALKEKEEEEKKEGKKEKKKEKEKEKKKKNKKKKKKDLEEQQINEADLIGLGDEGANETIGIDKTQQDNTQENNNNPQSQENKQSNLNDDLFDIFSTPSTNTNNNETTNSNINNGNPFDDFIFSNNTNKNEANNIDMPKKIFENEDEYPTTKISICYNQNNLLICSQFQRTNGQLQLGLYFSKGGTNCQINLNKNTFGLICQSNSKIKDNKAFFPMINNPSNSSGQPPASPFIIDAVLNYNGEQLNIQIQMNIFVLFIENAKLVEKPFVEFYSKNRGHDFNKNIYTYSKYKDEEKIKNLFEKKNLLFSARQSKVNPPLSFYSSSILGSMPFLVESFLNNGIINIKIIANNEKVIPLIKGAIDEILN
jgi:hypothetical protein